MLRNKKLDELATIEEKFQNKQKKPNTIWNLVNSIHSSLPLREWVTIESRPLIPLVVPIKRDEAGKATEVIVHLLLASQDLEGQLINPPWAYVSWHWPSGKILAIIDIRSVLSLPGVDLDEKNLCTSEFAEKIQEAIETGGNILIPPEALLEIYYSFLNVVPITKVIDQSQIILEADQLALKDGQPNPEADSMSLVKEGKADYLSKIQELLVECGYDSLLKEWQLIRSKTCQPHFSVAVVGEFSRGKSTLINNLLESNILPVGDLPTTTTITRIAFGNGLAAWKLFKNGTRERLSLDEGGQLCIENGNEIDAENILQVEIPNEWLKQTGIQFIDTPGTGDITGDRAALNTEVISSCDVTVVAISATMPLSQTERVILEKHILARKVPRVAVVLTRLDQVSSNEEKEGIVRFVKEKTSKWAPEAEVWISNDSSVFTNRELVDVIGPKAICKRLSDWATDEQHSALRSKQFELLSQDLLIATNETLRTEIESLKIASQEGQDKLIELQNSLKRSSLDWEDIRIELEKRERQGTNWLTENLINKKDAIVEDLYYNLRHSQNPKNWWEIDLPYLLNKKLAAIGKYLEENLERKVAMDAAWLDKQVKDKFSWEMQIRKPNHMTNIEKAGIKPDTDITDINNVRLLTRMGIGLATVVTYLLMGPLGIAVSIGGAVAGEQIVNREGEKQKEELRTVLNGTVKGVLNNASETITQRVKNFYKSMLVETQKQESMWFAAREKALNSEELDYDKIKTLEAYVERVDHLLRELGGLTNVD